MAVLADPARRRIVEALTTGEHTAGALGEALADQFGLSQPATSRHLRVLREAGLVRVRVDGPRRLYVLDTGPLRDLDAWLDQFRALWTTALAALDTEVARGTRARTSPGTEQERNRT